jgi:hypothetical protein
MNITEARRQMVYAMGSRCSECGKEFDPDEFVIHHTGFEAGERLGYQSPIRNAEIREYARTGKIPEGSKLLCDGCNRKRHDYRPSRQEIFGDRFRKFDRSARTGEFYINKTYPELLAQHHREVLDEVEKLRKENVGKNMEFLEVRPIPDIIKVDWEKKEINAIEVSRTDQLSKKRISYKNRHDWNHVILIQVEKGAERKTTYLWRRYRRIYEGSNNERKT